MLALSRLSLPGLAPAATRCLLVPAATRSLLVPAATRSLLADLRDRVGAGAVVAGMGSALGGAFSTTAEQQHLPAAVLARVSAIQTVTAFAFGPLAFAAAGSAAALLGARAVLGFGAAWSTLSCAVVLALPTVRAVRAVPPAAGPPAASPALASPALASPALAPPALAPPALAPPALAPPVAAPPVAAPPAAGTGRAAQEIS